MPASLTTAGTLFRQNRDLPFVALEEGISYQLLLVNVNESMWVVRMRFRNGATMPTHQHTGEVMAFTLKGRWRYREHPEVYEEGSFVFEPVGSTHTLQALPTDKGETEIVFINRGTNRTLDASGRELGVVDARVMLDRYTTACREAGEPSPPVLKI